MEETNESFPTDIEEIASVIENLDFTGEEIEFLLKKLEDLKNNNSVDQYSEELANFLINQLNKLKQTQEEDEISEEESIHLEGFGSDNGLNASDLRSLLQNKVEEFVVINLIMGGEYCQIEGVLCNVGANFITLIYQNQIIYIKIESIAAIERKMNNYSKPDDLQKNKRIKTYKDQYYMDETIENVQLDESKEDNENNTSQKSKEKCIECQSETKPLNSHNRGQKIKKEQKSYTEVNEE
ncbi:hypothetical protein [Acetohalobium arabaticum]|uniref:Uncharacterized protein n=1 Tax=Acetohalobium arabaticum (strain ATCC 49924 / DSM 5501 / Z-7288) TaxID=574087 RepID=D9QQ63_ACEAZ|nr:hypothetical protein [Acetohalobium arabaticum]ADL12654.1 hypothetical protein Acear_1132 [Acetohalobium arabaticum DSM 5501]